MRNMPASDYVYNNPAYAAPAYNKEYQYEIIQFTYGIPFIYETCKINFH